jgi:IS30 family transposase
MAKKTRGKRPFYLTKKEKEKIVALYKEGKSVLEIAARLERGYDACRKVLRAEGIHQGRKRTKIGKAPKAPPKKRARNKQGEQIAYLEWALKGAVNGWLERLVKDLANGKFTEAVAK